MHLVNSIRFFDIDLARDHNIYFSIAFFPELKIFGTPMTVIIIYSRWWGPTSQMHDIRG